LHACHGHIVAGHANGLKEHRYGRC
jgi:hypothetical protein